MSTLKTHALAASLLAAMMGVAAPQDDHVNRQTPRRRWMQMRGEADARLAFG